MKITTQALSRLEDEFAGYLEGGAVSDFFAAFDIHFAAGHWCAGGFADRFAAGGYNPGLPADICSQLERVARAGIEGVEFHEAVFLDEKGRLDRRRLDRVRGCLADLGLVPTNMNTDLWSQPRWKYGSLTSPDAAVRRAALAAVRRGGEIARELGCTSVSLWPGADGWDYNFEADYRARLAYFIEGCVEINRRAADLGLRFGIEAKMKEPREGNMIVPTTHCALLFAGRVNGVCGGENMGVAVDYGHEMMNGLEPAFNLHLAASVGVPVINFHVNSAKWRSNDEDRIAGTADIWQMVDFCLAAIETGYDGWFGEDQFTYRVDPVRAMALSREFFANCMKKALLIHRRQPELEAARRSGDAADTLAVVRKIIYSG